MKIIRFGDKNSEKWGIIGSKGEIRDLSSKINVLELGKLAELNSLNPEELPLIDSSVRLGACVKGVGKIVCIGLNYSDHAAETGAKTPSEPVIFMKATSAICGPHDPIVIPQSANKEDTSKVDWEVELAIVIGRKAKNVSESQALEHAAGFCIMNDVSERGFQKDRGGQWTKGKSCDTFAPLGPWLVTKDEMPALDKLQLKTLVNGEIMQEASSANMIFEAAFLVSYVSQFMTLHPGDVISTGTPGGVGMGHNPPRYLKPGDMLEISISGLGTQRRTVLSN